MTDDNQNETMPTPQPLPGQVFIRPGIDDRPDYEKTLTPEAKAALKRLAVQQRPRVPEASNERPEVQAARLAEGGSPLTAAAHLDAAHCCSPHRLPHLTSCSSRSASTSWSATGVLPASP